MVRDLCIATVDDERRALGDTDIDVPRNLRFVLARNERAHLRFFLERTADDELRDARLQARDEGICRRIADGDDDGERHTPFARGAVRRTHERVGRRVEIGIGHHDRVIFRATHRLHALAVCRGGRVDVLRNRRRTDEAQRDDARIVQERIDGFLIADDAVEDTRRAARFHEEFGEEKRAARIFLRRLEHERVPARERHGQHPERHHFGKVKRRNTRDDADRLAQAMHVDTRRDAARKIALEQMRDTRREFHHFDPTRERRARVGDHFAVFARNRARDSIGVCIQEFAIADQDTRARECRSLRPRAERVRGTRDRTLDIGAPRELHARRDRTRGRIVHVTEAPARPSDVGTVDEVFDRANAGGARCGCGNAHGVPLDIMECGR